MRRKPPFCKEYAVWYCKKANAMLARIPVLRVVTMNRLLAFLVALLLVAPLSAKEGLLAKRTALAPPTVTTINGTPLRINVGSDNSYQIYNSNVVGGGGQFYPTSGTQTADSGWFVKVGETLYAPNFGEHGISATGSLGTTVDFSETALTGVGGAGTVESPFSVSVVNGVGDTGLTATTSNFYVQGSNYITQRFRLVNTSPNVVEAKVFLGSDIYLASSDSGVPFLEPQSNSPGGRTCPGVLPEYTILHIPLTPASRYTGTGYADVWAQIGAGSLDNTLGSGCIDNGAALQWNVSVPPNGSVSVLAATSFGEIPPITQFGVSDVNPFLGQFGTNVEVRIVGFGFLPATTFSFGAGVTVTNLQIQSATLATATLQIASDAVVGWRDVVATQTPGGIVSTLIDGFAVTDEPVFNYSIIPGSTVNPLAVACVRAKFPASPVNAAGWAPDEGTWYTPEIVNPPFTPHPPTGLARAILDCHVQQWFANPGILAPGFCWDEPSPEYLGEYPEGRFANLRLYHSINGNCDAVPPPGTTIYESNVLMVRQPFLLLPTLSTGFED